MRVIRELAKDESIYLVNSINPFRIEGQKTVAIEMLEQRDWRVPDYVVVPGGNLGNSTALGKGFKELLDLGLIDRLPALVVVQAEGAAPFANLFRTAFETMTVPEEQELVPVEHPQTLATAIKIGAPVSWQKALRAVTWTGGSVLTVSEMEIANAKAMIGRDGIGCEPASATTVAGLRKLVNEGALPIDADVVAVLTGHVLKDTDYAIRYHTNELFAPDESQLEGSYRNPPERVEATSEAILRRLKTAP
jgi:threonine synthase